MLYNGFFPNITSSAIQNVLGIIRRKSRLDAFNVWDIEVIWCKRIKEDDNIKKEQSFVKKKKTKHWLFLSFVDGAGIKASKLTASRFYTRRI